MTHEQELLVAGVLALGECTDTVSKFWSRKKVAED